MKLWLSSSKSSKKQHIVLDMTPQEEYVSRELIREYVLPPGVMPVRTVSKSGQRIRYRFHMRFFRDLRYTFPHAELSPGIYRKLSRISEKHAGPVPQIDLLEFQGIDLYDFQKVGVARIMDGFKQDRGHLLNDEMGLGKTIQALAAIDLLGQFPVLIAVPKNGLYAWKRYLDDYTEWNFEVVEGTRAQRSEIIRSGADGIIINPEALRISDGGEASNPALFDIDWALFIADEFHRFKNPTAQQTVGFHALRHEYFLGMSGTPIENSVDESWSALHKMNPELYPDYEQLVRRLCVKKKGKIVGYVPEVMAEVKDNLDSWSTRRRKEEISDDLPRVIPIERRVELTTEQRRLYDQILEDAILERESGEKSSVNPLAVLTRLKQAAFSPELYDGSSTSAKIEELREILWEIRRSGDKAIVFSQWSTATRILQREFADYNPAYVDGSVSSKERLRQQDKFNRSRDCHLYIGTIGANREVVTLDAGGYVIFTDKDWKPTVNAQAAARSAAGGLRGVGRTKPIHIISLIAEETVEPAIEELLLRKQLTFNTLIEKDGGPPPEKVTSNDLMRLLFG